MPQLKKILVPVDFSECSYDAFRYALSLAKQYESEIVLLHVIDARAYESIFHIHMVSQEEMLNTLTQHAMKKYERMLIDFDTAGVKIEQRVTQGHPYVEIVREAAYCEMDIVVIGTHGRSGLDHILFGSVAEKVVRKAPCPVLAIKPKHHSFKMPGKTRQIKKEDLEIEKEED
jgi:nucleotide-binding universal stress UspA family protein